MHQSRLFLSLLAFAATVGAAGCTSNNGSGGAGGGGNPGTGGSTGTGGTANDAGGTKGTGGTTGTGGSPGTGGSTGTGGTANDAGGTKDTGTAKCDGGFTLPTNADSGVVATCSPCLAQMCAAEVAGCQADCDCAGAFACLQANEYSNSSCPAEIDLLSAGNKALTDLDGCKAMTCMSSCF
jgi:hypothetical protein